MRPKVPTILAAVLPVLVLIAASRWLLTEQSHTLSAEALVNDAALAKAPPGIVIVGNSKSRSDVDAVALKKALGYERPVANVLVAGSSAPAWYAMLEQRVYAKGYKPELIVVYGQLAAMLRVEAESAGERRGVEGQLSAESPVLDAKVLGGGASLGRARKNATAAHDALLAGVRDLAVGLFLAPPSAEGLRAAGKATAEPALAKTFGASAQFREVGAARVLPVAEQRKSEAMTASDVAPADSLLPDLIDLAEQNGARIVFVRAPLPPASRYMDALSPETEAAAFELLNQREASYIDLQSVGLPGNAWRDHLHLAQPGRSAVTEALARAMAAARILEGGVATARPVLLPAKVSRVGAPPAPPTAKFVPTPNRACGVQAALPDLAFLSDDQLQASGFGRSSPLQLVDATGPLTPRSAARDLGDACIGEWQHRRMGAVAAPRAASAEGLALAFTTEPSVRDPKGGQVWWVYPGTATEWAYDQAWNAGETLRVQVTARAARGGRGTLKVGDTLVPLEDHGRLLRASVEVPAPAAPWTVSVAADPDTWLVLDELVLGEQRLVGEPPVTLTPLTRAFEPPPAPPPVDVGAIGTEGTLTTIAVPGFGHVDDTVLRERIQYPCSPLQVAAESAPDTWMTEAHLLETMVRQPGRRGFGHFGERLLLAAPSDKMPAGPYKVRLDPRRKCDTATWLYPGDELVWKVVASVDRLRLGPDMLVLSGVALLPEHDERASAPVRVRVRVDDPKSDQQVEAELELPAQGGYGRACLPFPEPFPPATRMELSIAAPGPDAWFVLQGAQIGESEHLGGCAE